VSDPATHLLSGEQVAVLKFAAHRQLARWAHKPELSPRQQKQRAALVRAVRTMEDRVFITGCELRATPHE
jgi:hypothetical protein